MTASSDPRTVQGHVVCTRARLVTSELRCRQLFGSNRWKTELVEGTVTSVEVEVKNGKRHRKIRAKWRFPDAERDAAVHLGSVKLPAHTPIGSGQDEALQGAQNTEKDANPAETATNTRDVDVTVGSAPHPSRASSAGPSPVPQPALVRPSSSETPRAPTVEKHGRTWQREEFPLNLNGPVAERPWSVTNVTGDRIVFGHGPSDMRPMDFFMWMFPETHLKSIVDATNQKLQCRARRVTSSGEVLRLLGIFVLISRNEFPDRRSLWSATSESKNMAPLRLGRLMSRKRFEELVDCICFAGSVSSEDTDRWADVTGFIEAINNHRHSFFTPAERICVDESISRWYGLGGDYLKDKGLPHYVALERKPENGCEFKSACCGESGIMLRVELTRCVEETRRLSYESEEQHGTAITLRLVEPWFNSGRIICADSYFASVATAACLRRYNLWFIGVVKTATKGFPNEYLGDLTLQRKGQFVSMSTTDSDTGCKFMAIMWLDRERRLFISTTGSTAYVDPIRRERWTMVDNEAQLIEKETPIPDVCATYYSSNGKIDQHNRCRQADLNLEKKLRTMKWGFRVNTSLFSICVVDAWILYKGYCGSSDHMTPWSFYCKLADELIDNEYDSVALRKRRHSSDSSTADSLPISGMGIHTIETTRKRRKKDGTMTNHLYQGRCAVCQGNVKTKHICSACKAQTGLDIFLCANSRRRGCLEAHVKARHDIDG